MAVKLLGLSGSPRRGATEYVLQEALKAATSAFPQIETELMVLRGRKVAPCNGCGYCKKNKTRCCMQDDMQELFDRFVAADAYLVASPVYVMGPTPQLAAFFSRLRPVHHVFPEALRNKVGGAIAVGGTRNGGQEVTVNLIINYLLTRGLVVVGGEIGGYAGGKVWSRDLGAEGAGEDDIGMDTVKGLARKVAEVAVIMHEGRKALKSAP
ncbi:flavodoxin family protein [Thermanaeromonas sp. C210]|uniref:flavodoxin family protein n=1 Tax=Thermanaeromonas sp. C210 TaxID=2731925 RepID=UPI00155B5AA9|nr:flavodoxin family protein [Thermanaeromonas sp. C210]GFN21798.1 NAD(FAD)-dependent dehydrogenase [Thermanaeromonas sp. C210]